MAYCDFPTVWVQNNPESLLNLTLEYCVKNPYTFCSFDAEFGYQLRHGFALPQEICERMLEVAKTQLGEEEFYKFIRVFADNRTRLRRVDLSDTPLRNSDLLIFFYHAVHELNLKGCQKLNRGALKSLVKFSESLQSLLLGSNTDIFSDDDKDKKKLKETDPLDKEGKESEQPDKIGETSSFSYVPLENWDDEDLENINGETEDCFSKNCFRIWMRRDKCKRDETQKLLAGLPELSSLPALRKFVAQDLNKTEKSIALLDVVASTSRLTHLDLTHSRIWKVFKSFVNHPLVSLVLCDAYNIQEWLPSIYEMKKLRYLDLSNTENRTVMYENPNQVLKCIVDNLVDLVYLDISGTNLAGTGTIERLYVSPEGDSEPAANLTDIPGLASRVQRPLEFLGLLNCPHQACYRHHIPANRVAGDNGEEQILIAGQVYCQREAAIQKVLNDLFSLFRYSECKNIPLALDVIMEAMRVHLKKKSIQVAGSASLFYIVKSDHKDLFNVKMRKKIIKTLIDAMFAHYSDTTMLRNGCLAIIHFKIPEDMFFDYERFASLLLLIVSQDDQDEFVQRIGVYLLNSLACQVDGIEKKLVGDRGAITIMLQIIQKRLERHVCDEVMETAWSTMWNVTDETPINCARFLEGSGMDLFLQCLDAFPSKPELLRNMMGLLGNVAEVKELRRFLMKEEYISVFSDLLDSRSDGIEVSYNAAGILSHIASDGPDLWERHNIVNVKRSEVLSKMVRAIESWDLKTNRNINYRSFKPILRLLSVNHTPEAQIWAVWALTNLTKVYPDKYCMLLKREGGITLLENLIKQGNPKITHLAQMTIDHCLKYESEQDNEMPSDNEDIDIIN